MFSIFVCLEDKVWTTVMNNLPPGTTVTGSSRERRTVLQVNYSASMDQVKGTYAACINMYSRQSSVAYYHICILFFLPFNFFSHKMNVILLLKKTYTFKKKKKKKQIEGIRGPKLNQSASIICYFVQMCTKM